MNNYSVCDFIGFPTNLDFSQDISQAMKTTKTLLMAPFSLKSNKQFQNSFQKEHKQDQQKQALLKKRKEICQDNEEKLKSQKDKRRKKEILKIQKQTPNQEIGRENIKTKTKVIHHKKESHLNSSSRNNSDHVNSTFSKNLTSEAEMVRFGF
ncbi:hypothetical protein M0813_08500 [Anaeramoeba flamelloides]|uniref:Uncharacterized protein n=1 Tax=Anaeramoeba flamelloides TaxID=1746091 RepID=A0ABQ8X8M6_9EUKA|nr:hypothetical protein M0813_08500 [Anaeramoeba flamelloides]